MFDSPDEPPLNKFLYTSFALVSLLIVVVPAITLIAHVSLIASVAGAGIIYLIILHSRDALFEGIASAVFVLAVFNANVSIFNAPGKAQLDLLLVDVVALLAFTLLVIKRYPGLLARSDRLEKIVVSAFGVFTIWSFAAALVANGSSQSAAFVFALNQSRNLFLLLTSILIVRETCVKCGLYPILVSVFGNLAFSLLEVVNGSAFGLTYLGEGYGRTFSQFSVIGIVFDAGMYAGGFTSNSRVLTALLLLCLPIYLCATFVQSRPGLFLNALIVLGTILLIRVSDTDAGWMAFLVTLGVLLAYSIYYSFRGSKWHQSDHFRIGINSTVAAVLVSYLYLQRPIKTSTNKDAESGMSSSDTSGAGSAASGVSNPETQFMNDVMELLSVVPYVSTNTLPVRLRQYIAAIELGIQYPFFGIGGANFNLVSESFGIPPDMAIHNTVLAYLAATGFPGAIGYLVSIVVLLYLCFKRSISTERDDYLLWAGITAGMIGFHAFSFWVTSHNWLEAQAVFWLLAGIVLSTNDNYS